MKGKGGPENSIYKFRGVRQRVWGKWVAEIREPNRGKRMWLGTFPKALEAVYAYDEAARSMYGHSARLNFPLGDGNAYSGDARTRISESYSSEVLKESGRTESCGVLVDGGGAATEERTLFEPNVGMIQSLLDFTDVEIFDVDEILRMLDADPWKTVKAAGLGAASTEERTANEGIQPSEGFTDVDFYEIIRLLDADP